MTECDTTLAAHLHHSPTALPLLLDLRVSVIELAVAHGGEIQCGRAPTATGVGIGVGVLEHVIALLLREIVSEGRHRLRMAIILLGGESGSCVDGEDENSRS